MIHFRQMNAEEISDLYNEQMTEDFPKDELKPLDMILELLPSGQYKVYSAENDSGKSVAYMGIFKPDGTGEALLDYFAVYRHCRGSGWGTQVISAFSSKMVEDGIDELLIECEEPAKAENPETAERRIRFYLNSGVEDTRTYMDTFGVIYRILRFGKGKGAREQSAERLYRIYSRMIGSPKIMEKIRVL